MFCHQDGAHHGLLANMQKQHRFDTNMIQIWSDIPEEKAFWVLYYGE